ncbi:MAG: hypothetical protein JWQ43_2192 [Glaciihabitans sp.]|nr:hypothetical protein [Glaciihabitans sp.]
MRFVLILAIGAVIVGTITVATASTQTFSFGWTAYAPLSDTTFSPPGARFLSPSAVAGFLVLAAGLVALAFWGGFAVGSRRPTTAPATKEEMTSGEAPN